MHVLNSRPAGPFDALHRLLASLPPPPLAAACRLPHSQAQTMEAAVDKMVAAQARLAAAGDSCPDLDHLLEAIAGVRRAEELIPANAMSGGGIALPKPMPNMPKSVPLFKARPDLAVALQLPLAGRLAGWLINSAACMRTALQHTGALSLPSAHSIPRWQGLFECVKAGTLGTGSIGYFTISPLLLDRLGTGLGVSLPACLPHWLASGAGMLGLELRLPRCAVLCHAVHLHACWPLCCHLWSVLPPCCTLPLLSLIDPLNPLLCRLPAAWLCSRMHRCLSLVAARDLIAETLQS